MAQDTFFVDMLYRQKIRIPTAVLIHREHHIILPRGIDHLLQLIVVQRHRLFAYHVLARPHGLDADILVQMIGDRYGDKLHTCVRKHRLKRGINIQTLGPRLIAGCVGDIINTQKLQAIVLKGVCGMDTSHAAVTDDC